MPINIYSGWLTLAGASRAGQFPPTLNKETDLHLLAPHESPDCYGIDPDKVARLKKGTVPTGVARTTNTSTISETEYLWYFNRLWKINATTASILDYFAPACYDAVFRQGVGRLEAMADIITFMPALGSSMWLGTASGSQFCRGADDRRGFFALGQLVKEMAVNDATRAVTLDGVPFTCNASGVFSFTGREVVEWTAPIRNALGSFASVEIKADYEKKWIVGTGKFVLDVANKKFPKLFDFGTAGFRFTSRTLVGSDFRPFRTDSIAFILEQSDNAGGEIAFETKLEDGDWIAESPVAVRALPGRRTREEVYLRRVDQTAQRFALRITSLPENIYIREIQVNVAEYAFGAPTE